MEGINQFLSDITKEKGNITDAIIIYITKDNKHIWQMTENISLNNAIGMLERTKLDVIKTAKKV